MGFNVFENTVWNVLMGRVTVTGGVVRHFRHGVTAATNWMLCIFPFILVACDPGFTLHIRTVERNSQEQKGLEWVESEERLMAGTEMGIAHVRVTKADHGGEISEPPSEAKIFIDDYKARYWTTPQGAWIRESRSDERGYAVLGLGLAVDVRSNPTFLRFSREGYETVEQDFNELPDCPTWTLFYQKGLLLVRMRPLPNEGKRP